MQSAVLRASLAALLVVVPACGGGAASGGAASDTARLDTTRSAAAPSDITPPAAAPSVAGRWQRVDLPDEWIEFSADSSFRGQSFTGTDIRGRYRQQGGTVTLEVLPRGHGATLTLHDTLLVMEEGTRYRRAPR